MPILIARAAVCGALALAASAADLTVRVYNEARVSRKALGAAIDTAARAFRRAGIETSWKDCLQHAGACSEGPGIEMILAEPAAAAMRAMGAGNRALAFSLLPEEGGGVYAKVLWNRVQRFAEANDAPAAAVLGYAMAHEICHLVLHTDRHAPGGLMKALWSRGDAIRLGTGRLAFREREAAAMRGKLGRIALKKSASLADLP